MAEATLEHTQPTDQRSFGTKLEDEGRLLLGSGRFIWSGIKSGLNDMYEHPAHAAEAFAMGAVAGVMYSNPYGRLALYGLTALGVGAMVAPEAKSVWESSASLPGAEQSLGDKLGQTIAYMPVAGAGSYLGARAATVDWRGIYTRAQVALTGDEPPAATFTQESADRLFSGRTPGVVDAQKQHYPVRFDRITEGMYTEPGGLRINSLETIAQGTPGELVTADSGKFLATRVTPEGATVTEGGHPVVWSIKPDKILKAYDITPEQIEGADSFTAWTKVAGAPKVAMYPLHSAGSIEAWGTTLTTQARPQPTDLLGTVKDVFTGKPLGWLSHYSPGDNAMVSPIQFSQTYEVVMPPIWPRVGLGAGVGALDSVMTHS